MTISLNEKVPAVQNGATTKFKPIVEEEYRHSKVVQIVGSGPGAVFGDYETLKTVYFDPALRLYVLGTSQGRIKLFNPEDEKAALYVLSSTDPTHSVTTLTLSNSMLLVGSSEGKLTVWRMPDTLYKEQ